MSAHVFDVDDATRYGVNAAIVLDHIRRWIAHNKGNGINQRDGRTWTFNSVKAWSKIVPYLTSKQVRKAIDDLISSGVLITGNFNKNPYDRTLWYALADEICPVGQMDPAPLPCGANGSALEVKCLEHRDTKEEPSITSEPTEKPEADELTLEAGKFVIWFIDLLSKTNAPAPRVTPSILKNWSDAYVKLRRIDGKTKEEIAKVCRWARGDPFWSGNFFSPCKLRDRKDGVSRFDLFLSKITLSTNGNAQHQRPNPRDCESTRTALDEYREYDQRMAAGEL